MAAPHQRTLRQSLRSALSHKRLADQLLDTLVAAQNAWNTTSAKIAADSTGALDTDYNGGDLTAFDFDAAGTLAQHKASLRTSLRSALAHKYMADEIIDAIEEFETALNTLHAKLDAEAGTLNDTDYASLLGLTALDPDAEGILAQHKATMRTSLKSALSHSRLADQILDSLAGLQSTFNTALAVLDTTSIAVEAAPVTAIDPDAS
jgi:hypothetical protein